MQDAMLANQNAASMRTVFAPKVDGAEKLVSDLPKQPVNQVSFFSSVAGVLGSSGQANYAAANASLDALSTNLQSQVLTPCTRHLARYENNSGFLSSIPRPTATCLAT